MRLRVEAGQCRFLACTLKTDSGLSLRHFQTDLPLHTPGGWDHYIKGWVQRRTNRMWYYGIHVNNSLNIGLRESFPHLTRFKDVICFSRPFYTLIILTLTFVMFRSYYLSKEKSLSTGAPSSELVLLRRYENPPNI